MIITAWILLIIFGVLSLAMLRKLFLDSMTKWEMLLMLISVFVASISAGVIFGGLVLF